MPPPAERVTLAEVARLAGVSLATASRAMTNAYGVSPATRQRVLDVARRLQFVPSPEASRLAGGVTQRVALVVPHLERWFFSSTVAGIQRALAAADLDVLLYLVAGAEDRQRFFADLPAIRKVDALVMIAFPIDESERQRLDHMGVTVVSAGGPRGPYPYVTIDDLEAGHQAVDHLLQLGHRRIAMIEAEDRVHPRALLSRRRSQAFHAAMSAADIDVDPRLIVTIDWGGLEGAEGMARLLSLRNRPTAVYAHSDEIAVGAMRTLRRAGLRVPEDISLIGIDDHPVAELLDLTTVHRPLSEQASRAAELVLGLLRGEDVERAVTIGTHLVVRGSTAPPRR